MAVQTLLVLNQIREPFVPAELEVYAATHGFDIDQAHEYRVFAEKVQDGRSFRPAIRLAAGQAERYVDYWASNPDG